MMPTERCAENNTVTIGENANRGSGAMMMTPEMIERPVGRPRRALGRLWLLGLLALVMSCALPVARAQESSDDILKKIDEVGERPVTEAQIAELDALWKRYEEAIDRERIQLEKERKDGVSGAPTPTPQPRGEPTPTPTPKPKVSTRRAKASPTPTPTPAPTPGATRRDGGPEDGTKPAGSRRDARNRSTPPVEPLPGEMPAGAGVELNPEFNVDAEFLKPFDRRDYTFSIKDGTYAELIEVFARMASLPVIGEAPAGTVTFISSEVLDFKAALGQVQMLLFNHPDKYWVFLRDGARDTRYLEVVRLNERTAPIDNIYSTLEAYLAADLDDNDLALLLYVPETGSIADLEPLRQYMPDYVRIAQYGTQNAVTIFCLVRDINNYLELIEKFRISTSDPRTIKVIPIEHVLPSEALEKLKILVDGFDTDPGQPASRRRAGEDSVAEAQARGVDAIPFDFNQTLLVRAMPKKMEEIESLLPYIDVAETDFGSTPVVVRVQHAHAGELITLVSSLLGAGNADPAVSSPSTPRRNTSRRSKAPAPETPSASAALDELVMIEWTQANSILLIGKEDKIAEARALIEKFDVPDEMRTRVVALQHQTAEDLVPAVNEMFQVIAGGEATGLLCTTDPTGNAIVLVGSETDIAKALDIITTLDIEDTSPAETVHSITVYNVRPSSLVGILTAWDSAAESTPQAAPAKERRASRRRTAASGTKFHADDATGQLHVICTDEEWTEKYGPMITKLDADVAEGDAYAVIPIQHLEPAEAIDTLSTLFADPNQQKGGAPAQFVAVPGGVMVVQAAPGEIEKMKQVIAEFDVPRRSYEERRMFTLAHADPGAVLEILNAEFSAGAQPARAGRKGAAAATSTGVRFQQVGANVWAWAPRVKMEEIAELISVLDVPATEKEIRPYDFAVGTNVNELAQSLASFFPADQAAPRRQRGKGAEQASITGGDDILIIPQPAARRILVSAPVNMFPEIERTIEMLRPATDEQPGIAVEFFTVENGDIGVIAQQLENIMTIRLDELIDSGAIPAMANNRKPGLSITADPTTGRIIVALPEVLMPEAAELIKKFESGEFGEIVPRRVALENADADEMASTIGAMLSGRVSSPRASASGRRRGGRRAPETASTPVPQTTPSGVTVVPVPGGDALVLTGPIEEVDEVESWVKMLDEASTSGRQMKVYKLDYADVEDAADVIMATMDSAPPVKAAKSADDSWFDDDIFSMGGPRSGADIKLTTDYFSNTMIVWASPKKLKEIDAYLELYEKGQISTSDRMPSIIIELKNADPYDAKLALEDIIDATWEGDKPKVEYIPFQNAIVVKSKSAEDFPEIEKLVADYIDKPGSPSQNRFVTKAIKGMPVDEAVIMLLERLDGIEVEVEGQAEGKGGYGVKILTPEEVERCVLPSTLIRAMESLGGSIALQAAPQEDEPAAETKNAEPTPPAAAPADDPDDTVTISRKILDELLMERARRQSPSPEPSPTPEPGKAGPAASTSASDETAPATGKLKLRLIPDPLTNSVSFAGPAKAVADAEAAMEKIIEDIEGRPVLPDIRIWQLKYLDPNVAAQVIESMFNEGGRAVAGGAAGNRRAMLQAQQRAMQEQMARLQNENQNQNQPQGDEEQGKGGDRRRGQPEGKEAPEPAAPAPTPTAIQVFPYPALSAIIVKAPTEMFPAVERLVATIDRKSDAKTDEYRFFKIRNQLASDVEQQLKTMFGLEEQAQTRARPGRTRGRGDPAVEAVEEFMRMQSNFGMMMDDEEGGLKATESVTVTSNNVTNTVMVLAPRRILELVEKIIADIDEQVPETIETRTYPLQYADATVVVPHLKELYAGGGRSGGARGELSDYHPDNVDATFIADSSNNGVIVRAKVSDHDKIAAVIKQIDVQTGSPERAITVELTCGDAVNLAKSLETIYGLGKLGKGSGAKKIQFVGDQASNTVFYVAPEELREEINTRIHDLDQAACSLSEPRFIMLEVATATTVAKTIEAAFSARTGGKSRVQVTGEDTTKRLMVVCPEEIFPKVEKLAHDLDVAPESLQFRAFKLTHARAPAVLEQMDAMVRTTIQQLRNTGVRVDPFSATADERSNALLVMGGPVAFALVEQVLTEIDVPQAAPIAIETLVIALTKARATEVAGTINRLFQGRKDGIDPPRAEANESTNTLLVRGTRSQIEEIQNQVIKPLDEFAEPPQMKLHEEVIALKYIQAQEAAEYLNSWFNDRRRAYDALKQHGIPPQELTVAITPEPGSNQLVVMASDKNLELIRARVADIDKEGTGTLEARVSRVYNIKYADPNGVLNAIQTAFKAPRGAADKDRVDTSVEWATQTIVVTAGESKHAAVAELIQALDKEGGQGRGRFIYNMKDARASNVARLVNQTMETRPQTRTGQKPVNVVPDDELNVLIVTATQTEYDEILPLIETLDHEPAEGAGLEIQVYNVKFADPGSLLGTINNSFPASPGTPPEDRVRASYTWGTSSLVVSASKENHVKIAELLATIDVESSVDRVTHVIKLQHANSDELAARLTDMVNRTDRRKRDDQGAAIVSDPGTNSLLVFANDKEMERIQELITSLDVPAEVERETKIYAIKYADPNGVNGAIQNVFRVDRRTSSRERVDVAIEWATQSVIVTASAANHQRVADLIGQLDQESSSGQVRKIYTMVNARASNVARLVTEALRSRQQTRTGRMPVNVVADDDLNVLIITASQTEYEEILPLIETLDQKPTAESGLVAVVYPVRYADPGSLITTINSSFPPQRGSPAKDTVRASYIWGTASLVVSASKENHEKVKDLIAAIDVESTVNRETHVLRLTEGNAEDMARRLSDIMTRTQRRGRDDQGAAIVADPGTNSLLVFANEEELNRIKELVATLDVAPTLDREIRTFNLTFAEAWPTREAILELYGRASSGRVSPRDEVKVVVDWGSNSVIVSASPSKLADIEEFIKQTDQAGGGGRDVRVVELKNADPQSVARSLNDMFVQPSRDTRGQQTISISAPQGAGALLIRANDKEFEEISAVIASLDVVDDGTAPHIIVLEKALASDIEPILTQMFVDNAPRGGAGGGSGIRPVIVANDATNSLIVRGDPAAFSMIETLVAQLDNEDANPGARVKLIQLTSTFKAADLASTIEETLRNAAPPSSRTPGRGGGRGGSGDVSVQAIVASNTLLIAGDPKMLLEAEAMVGQILAMGPAGGEKTIIFSPGKLSADEVKRLIDEMSGGSGSSTSRSRGNQSPARTPRRR